MTGFRQYLQTVCAIFRKDVQVEWRGRQGVPVMLVFSLLVVFLFNFALQLSPQLQSGLASGLLWVTLAFAATLGLNRSAALERENNALNGLMLAPVDRSAIFFGKTLSNLASTLLVAFILMPTISLFFGQNLLKPALFLVVILGTGAYTCLGTILSALSIQSRTRDVLLPVLLYPLALPILIAASEASRGILSGQTLGELQNWLYLLLACGILFTATGLLLFETILEE